MRQFKRNELRPALLIGALALSFLAVSLLISSASAQKVKQLPPPPPPLTYKPKPTPTPAPIEYEVVKVNSNLVVVPVAVIDANGQPVLGLKQTDFHIEEDGRAQEIAQIGDPGQVPLDIALLIDVSSSVSERFAFEEQAATRFLKQVLRPADRATIYAIDRVPRLEQPLGPAETASAKLLAIKAATGPSPTAFYDTVMEAARYLSANTPERHRRVIVAITDGEDNFSNGVRDSAVAAYRASQDEDANSAAGRSRIRAASEAALLEGHRKAQIEMQREAQKANAVFYSINPSGQSIRLNTISTRAQNAMQALATATGGSAFVPDTISSLEGVFSRIASELRAQYLLQYYSNNESGQAFRKIVVTSPTHSQLRVRAREGYYPKAR
ncbi:MAG TPA: VWA domain-containing protein [Pyrinomonadaceae bacterium]|nr:VWA domain-containing protein [Pyrinomonadaceae bacterium]